MSVCYLLEILRYLSAKNHVGVAKEVENTTLFLMPHPNFLKKLEAILQRDDSILGSHRFGLDSADYGPLFQLVV
ncbi:hypothetical protein VNO77_22773 [Canavalia gladiata]|uniref:Uncharacterized protein n=1 Tax=Canavalia gladiata TaxID=3824 RepID=A0AAN9L6M9_CANGL